MTPHDLSSLDVALRLALAFLLGLPPGWVRERRSHSAGLRSIPLVSLCVCSFLLAALARIEDPSEHADVYYGVLTGIGFVGSGAMVKSPRGIVGMNTAVSLWVAGAMGAGVAYGAPLISAALSLSTALTLWTPLLGRRHVKEAE